MAYIMFTNTPLTVYVVVYTKWCIVKIALITAQFTMVKHRLVLDSQGLR